MIESGVVSLLPAAGPPRLPPPPAAPLPPPLIFPALPPQTKDSAQQNLPTSAGSTPLEQGTWRSRSWGGVDDDDEEDEDGGGRDDVIVFALAFENVNVAFDVAGSSWSLLDRTCATRVPRWLLDATATRTKTQRARKSAS